MAEAVTDGNGYFGVTDLKPGQYFVEIDQEASHDRVKVSPGEVSRIQFNKR